MNSIQVIGAGLAGCEAAWQIASAGVPVTLWEMKPIQYSPAHQSPNFAELICSNSLKSMRTDSAAGLLKAEMRKMGSLLTDCAEQSKVPAGGALAVDRQQFSALATAAIENHPLITVQRAELKEIPQDGIVVIATGPLSAPAITTQIAKLCGEGLSFFDAAAPILTGESLDMGLCFKASRYDKGDDDYINCPMNKQEYEAFYDALCSAQRAPLHGVDVENPKVYEGCMPVEVMARRGADTLRFGPLKPVGLRDPRTGHRPWAVVQLRMEDRGGSLYNMVGFQTNLKFGEQKRVFAMIPGLQNAAFVRYGVMHRNTFLNSPRLLNRDLSLKKDPRLFFAGQITGCEGYMESASSGLLAGKNALRQMQGQAPLVLPTTTMLGALTDYVTASVSKDFQPMGANFGILPAVEPHIRDKRLRYGALAQRALTDLEAVL